MPWVTQKMSKSPAQSSFRKCLWLTCCARVRVFHTGVYISLAVSHVTPKCTWIKKGSRKNNIVERTMVLLERKGYLKPVVTGSDGLVKQDKEWFRLTENGLRFFGQSRYWWRTTNFIYFQLKKSKLYFFYHSLLFFASYNIVTSWKDSYKKSRVWKHTYDNEQSHELSLRGEFFSDCLFCFFFNFGLN